VEAAAIGVEGMSNPTKLECREESRKRDFYLPLSVSSHDAVLD
jgi:hypothetical protein